MDINSELLSFISRSPTAFHAVENIRRFLLSAGYRELFEGEDWTVAPGDRVFVRRNGSSIIALRIPAQTPAGLMLAAAHSDSPSFKIKDNALIGMGSVVLDHAVVGEGAIVAAGSVVTGKTVIPPHTLWAGVPAKYIKDVDPAQAEEMNQRIARDYHMYASWYK